MSMFVGLRSMGDWAQTVTSNPSGTASMAVGTCVDWATAKVAAHVVRSNGAPQRLRVASKGVDMPRR